MESIAAACTLLLLLVAAGSAEPSPQRQAGVNRSKRAVGESDVSLYLYTKRNPSKEEIRIGKPSSSPSFNASNPTRIVVHGWKANYMVMYSFVTAYLKAGDYNVILVDYSSLASSSYPTAILYTQQIADYLKVVIDDLRQNRGLNLNNVALIGHSLGGQLVGVLGNRLGGEVALVVGLDPAGPNFSLMPLRNRLDASDGKLVQVIHTNGGGLGFLRSCGDVDFFVNGGSKQAGCSPTLDFSGMCSHVRVLYYYVESINSKNFVGVQCDSNTNFRLGRCNNNPRNIMGEHVSGNVTGNFYLETNTRFPYGKSSP